MDEVEESGEAKGVKQRAYHVDISSNDEIDKLASELADSYIKFFTIDISEQKRKSEDSVEECLTHLEEVCSVIDTYLQNGNDDIAKCVKIISCKHDSINSLYDQIDALEQYIFEVNRLLDQLDQRMKELEAHKKSSGTGILQIMDFIPRLSLAEMPRLLSNSRLGGLIEDSVGPSYLDDRDYEDNEQSTASVDDILTIVANIEASIEAVTSNLDNRLDKNRQNLVD